MIDDYYCNNCEEVFEYRKPYGKDWPKNPTCPKCKKNKTKRQMTKKALHVPEHMKSAYNGR